LTVLDLKCSRYVVFSPLFLTVKGDLRQIAFSTLSGAWYALDSTSAAALSSGDLASLPQPLVTQFMEDKLLVLKTENEIANLLAQDSKKDASSDDYILTLMPSSFCQMRCSYCGQSHGKTHMSTTVQDATLRFVRGQFLSRNYRNMNVTWFGAEPLAGIGAIRKLTPPLRDICREAGARYAAYVITNGLLLTPRTSDELCHELGVLRIQVTLDGPRETHDRRRMLKDGTGTYDRIMANLREYARAPIPELQLHLRVNVDAKNVLNLGDLVSEILDAGLNRAISNVCLASVFDWGNGGGGDALPDAAFARAELEFLRQLQSLKVPVDFLPERATHACPPFYRDDSPLIDPCGNLHSCYEYPLARDTDSVPLGRSGSVFTGINTTKAQNRARLPELISKIASDPDDCLNCSMLPVCGGTCEPYRLRGRKRCPGYKYNLGDRLLLAYEEITKGDVNVH
jgi:uncharacterized protein